MTLIDASIIFGAVERRSTRILLSQQALDRLPRPFFTTEACVAEAMHLACSRIGWKAQDEIWQILVAADFAIVQAEIGRVERMMRRYRNVPMDFADATLVALVSVEPRLRVATFDSDLVVYRRDDGTPIPLVDDRLLGGS